jgi:hypothetical protein
LTDAAARPRQPEYLRRQRDGQIALQIEVDAYALEAAGFLRGEDADSREALEAALGKVVDAWVKTTVTRNLSAAPISKEHPYGDPGARPGSSSSRRCFPA